jgi:hypothetical protein
MEFVEQQFNHFTRWITEREKVRCAKESGAPKPWTNDAIIRNYRFCNVRRMDDKVSRWLLEDWYDYAQDTRTLVVAAALARMINWPDTLARITDGERFTSEDWNAARIRRTLHGWKDGGNKVFTGAYIVDAGRGGSKIDKVVGDVEHVATNIAIDDTQSMRCAHAALMGCPGIGSFMAGQIVADLRWVLWWPLDPEDAMTWAPIGPGSCRGMRRMLGREANGPMTQAEFEPLLCQLMEKMRAGKTLASIMRRLEAMDVQNCLCEFDKYMRLLNDEGTVRSGYPGNADSSVRSSCLARQRGRNGCCNGQ